MVIPVQRNLKNQSLLRRFSFAAKGIYTAALLENSFRTELFLASAYAALMIWLKPPLVWLGLSVIAAGLVLAAELLNTALEHLADRLHPEQHPAIGVAKDCAAAAVLVTSITAAVIGALTVALSLGIFHP